MQSAEICAGHSRCSIELEGEGVMEKKANRAQVLKGHTEKMETSLRKWEASLLRI